MRAPSILNFFLGWISIQIKLFLPFTISFSWHLAENLRRIHLTFFSVFRPFWCNNSHNFDLRVSLFREKLRDLPRERHKESGPSQETSTRLFCSGFFFPYLFLSFDRFESPSNVSWPHHRNVHHRNFGTSQQKSPYSRVCWSCVRNLRRVKNSALEVPRKH